MKWAELFGSNAVTQDFSEKTISAFFDEIDQDPLAGLGTLSKRQKLIDRIVAQHKIVLAQYRSIAPRQPAPIMNDRPTEVPVPLDLKAASLAKKAGM